MSSRHVVVVSLKEKQKMALDEIAQANKVSRAEVMRWALEILATSAPERPLREIVPSSAKYREYILGLVSDALGKANKANESAAETRVEVRDRQVGMEQELRRENKGLAGRISELENWRALRAPEIAESSREWLRLDRNYGGLRDWFYDLDRRLVALQVANGKSETVGAEEHEAVQRRLAQHVL